MKFTLAGCGTSTSNKKKVGIIQFMDHTSLNEIKDSFDKEMLRHLVKVSDANGRGLGEGLTQKDIDTIIKRFGRVKEDFER